MPRSAPAPTASRRCVPPGTPSSLLGLIFRMRLFGGRDAILFRGPGAEIDALAARRAKRPVAVFGDPLDGPAAARTGDDAGYGGTYRLHSVILRIGGKPCGAWGCMSLSLF